MSKRDFIDDIDKGKIKGEKLYSKFIEWWQNKGERTSLTYAQFRQLLLRK